MDTQFWLDKADSLFHQIFMIVMGGLGGIAYLFGTTYDVVNILVYYILIPASWIFLISLKTDKRINFISLGLIIVFVFLTRSDCDYIFQKSVDFLNWSASIFGSNYIDISVYICVLVVGVIYLILIPLTLSKRISAIILITSTVLLGLYMVFIYPNFKSILELGLQKMNIV